MVELLLCYHYIIMQVECGRVPHGEETRAWGQHSSSVKCSKRSLTFTRVENPCQNKLDSSMRRGGPG